MLIHTQQLEKGVSEESVNWWVRSYQGAASGCHPIWPSIDECFEVAQFPLRLPFARDLTLYRIPWRCISENMPATRGVGIVTYGDGMAHVGNFGMNRGSWAGESEDEKFEELKALIGV